ncbi:hypothetical protein BGZ79_006758 [Entomortierella chlamydospora]|nr:hypothetical protein BGZ79_006758 [Entomortierella chlamydospora]
MSVDLDMPTIQRTKRSAPSLGSFFVSTELPFRPPTPRPTKTAKMSLSWWPESSPRRYNTLPPLCEDKAVSTTSPPTFKTLEMPMPRFVRFSSADEKSGGKTSYLPRTPYPMTREDEERMYSRLSKP